MFCVREAYGAPILLLTAVLVPLEREPGCFLLLRTSKYAARGNCASWVRQVQQ